MTGVQTCALPDLEFTPWIPASFLPGALPTACGGSPGNTPVSADPRALEEEMAAWEIPLTEEPGWLQSIGSQKVRHN